MAFIEDVTFPGYSGTKYNFKAYDGTDFPSVGAVYIFTKRNFHPDGRVTYTRLYVGQTRSLADRIPGHEKWDCVKEHGVDTICVHLDGDEDSRRLKEKDLLDIGKPPCND